MNRPDKPYVFKEDHKTNLVRESDYQCLSKYCDQLEKENRNLINIRFGPVSEVPDPRAFFKNVTG